MRGTTSEGTRLAGGSAAHLALPRYAFPCAACPLCVSVRPVLPDMVHCASRDWRPSGDGRKQRPVGAEPSGQGHSPRRRVLWGSGCASLSLTVKCERIDVMCWVRDLTLNPFLRWRLGRDSVERPHSEGLGLRLRRARPCAHRAREGRAPRGFLYDGPSVVTASDNCTVKG